MWYKTFWIIAPAVVAGILLVSWCRGALDADTAGKFLQLLAAFPLAYTFRQRAATLALTVAQAKRGRGPVRWLGVFGDWLRGKDAKEEWGEEVWEATLDLLSLVMVLVYFIGGSVLQMVPGTNG